MEEKQTSLRQPLDEATNYQIQIDLAHGVSEAEMRTCYGDEALEAYFSNPDNLGIMGFNPRTPESNTEELV